MSELNDQLLRKYIAECKNTAQPNSNTGVQGLILCALGLILDDKSDPYNDVVAFHRKFQRHYDGPPRILEGKELEHRLQTMREEIDEYEEAVMEFSLAQTPEEKLEAFQNIWDALIDLVYFAMGTAHLHGFHNFNLGWKRVHAANMAKELSSAENPGKRNTADGSDYIGIDIVKPAGWIAPKLTDILV